MAEVHTDHAPPGGTHVAIPYSPKAARLRIAGLRGQSQGPAREPVGYYFFVPGTARLGDPVLIVPSEIGWVELSDEQVRDGEARRAGMRPRGSSA